MKILSGSILIFLSLFILAGCGSQGSGKKADTQEEDLVSAADSIVNYFSNGKLLKEVTFKDGVRNGLTKTFYPGGQLYQTFWYRNDLREDSAGWYYLEGQLFRSTPYRNDTIDGIQRQYYRTGKTKAKIGYSKGLRTTYFEEFDNNGKLLRNYPDIVVQVTDNYQASGRYIITLGLSDKSSKVKFYRGELSDGRFDTTKCNIIRTVDGKGTLELRKTGSAKPAYLNVIGEITTLYGNKYIKPEKIILPYNDLN
jgi:hypothetical protein